MIPNACCCDNSSCIIYGDNFSVDSIATSWDDVSGAWSISTGILSTDDAAALLIADTVHPDGDNQPQVVRVKVRLAAELDVARLIMLYEDSSNYLFVEFTIDGGCGRLQAYERVAGVNTAVGSEFIVPNELALNAWHTISLCYIDGNLRVRIVAATGEVRTHDVTFTATVTGDQAGLGAGAVVDDTIDFDDFSFQFHYDDVDHPACPQCATSEDCQLSADTFTRSDSTNVGCAWEEIAGDWEIDSGELTVAEEDAILRNRVRDPDDIAEVQVQFSFRAGAGVTVLAIFDYTDDSNLFFVKLQPGSHGDCGQVSFWRRTSGTDTQVGVNALLLGMSSGDTHSIVICWKNELVKATLTPAAGDYSTSSHSVYPVEQVATEPYVGLGTGVGGGSNAVWFDNFTLTRKGEACFDCGTGNCELYDGDPRVGAFDADTFNCLWTVETGTWATGTLSSSNADSVLASAEVIEAGANAMLLNETGHPGITSEGYLDLTSSAKVRIVTFSFGDIVRVLIGVEDDENYLYGEIEYSADDESTGFLRVGKVVAGTETELGETELTIAQGQPNNNDDALDGLGNVYQRGSELTVCYDGYELSALWNNGLGPSYPTAASVTGTAGLGWNPGLSGLETTTVSSSVFFGNFEYHHDIYGIGGCNSCYEANVRCSRCRSFDDSEDRTPLIMLLEITGMDYYPFYAIDSLRHCDEIHLYNDVYALPFRGESSSCLWSIRSFVCPHWSVAAGSTTPTIASHTITLTGNSSFMTVTAALGTSYSNKFNPSPSSQITASADWIELITSGEIPSFRDDGIVDCLAMFSDWVTLNDTVNRTNWLGVATARVKIP